MMGQTLITLVLLVGLGVMGELTSVRSAYCYVLPPLGFALAFGIRIVRDMPLSIRRAKMAARRMIGYGLRSYGIDVLGVLSTYIDQILLVALLAPAELGMYVVAASLARMLHMISGATSTVLFPKVAAQPLDQVMTYVSLSSRVTTTATGLIALALALAAPILLPTVYGPDFAPAVYIFPILLAESVLSGTVKIIGQGLMGAGRPGTITMVQGFGLACVLPLLALLVPPYGLMGAAVAMLLSTLLRLAFIAASYEILLRRRMPGLLIRRSDVTFLYRRIVS
jgi:O-antigen/teichoic acid export membrane protein